MTAPPPMRSVPKKRKRPTLVLWAVIAAVLIAADVAFIVLRPDDEPTAQRQPASTVPAPDATSSFQPGTTPRPLGNQLGLFIGTNRADFTAFEEWLGRPMRYVTDFGPRDTWADIANPSRVLSAWEDTDYRLVLAVPMIPNELAASKNVAMAAGADGDHNQYFRRLGENLVEAGQENAVLRIGWEFNLPTWPWGISDEKVFVRYWREIVTTMRAVPGQKFHFNWNPNNGFNPYHAEDYWPGNAYVHSVGVDAYDIDQSVYPYPRNCDALCKDRRQRKAWEQVILGGERGMQFWANFAQDHDKPFTLPEWGLWDRNDGSGGGDNPFFVQQMHDFITRPANNVAFASFFHLNSPDGKHELDNFPRSRKLFRQLFGPGAADTTGAADGTGTAGAVAGE